MLTDNEKRKIALAYAIGAMAALTNEVGLDLDTLNARIIYKYASHKMWVRFKLGNVPEEEIQEVINYIIRGEK